jgi:(4-O-methyl)-D-glucuronate---lignin esterase
VSHDIEAQGTVEDVDDTNYDWFSQQMQQFAGHNVYKLPFDQHELMAMVAPRALPETGNASQYWLSNRSNGDGHSSGVELRSAVQGV